MKPRTTPPTKPTRNQDQYSYVVWADKPYYLEDKAPIKPVACFYFFTEALEYKDKCLERGADIWLQTPCGVVPYKADGTRTEINAARPCECIEAA